MASQVVLPLLKESWAELPHAVDARRCYMLPTLSDLQAAPLHGKPLVSRYIAEPSCCPLPGYIHTFAYFWQTSSVS